MVLEGLGQHPATTTASWNYTANPNGVQSYTGAMATAGQNYGDTQSAQNYASAINWWQQQAQAHAQLAQQQAQAQQQQTAHATHAAHATAAPQQQPQVLQAPPQQQPAPQQQAVIPSQTVQTQPQLGGMNMYQQYSQQLMQYQQLQSGNYQHHSVNNFTGAASGSHGMDKMQPARRPMASPAKGGKRKKANRPKRPTSAYFFFLAKQRQLSESRGEKITRVVDWVKEVSAIWRALTPEEKVPFNSKAAEDKERYDREMGRHKNKDPNRPKRPTSAYFFFLAKQRQLYETRGEKISRVVDWVKEVTGVWRALLPEEKAPYNTMAAEDKERYDREMGRYRDPNTARASAAAASASAAAAAGTWRQDMERVPYQQNAEGDGVKQEGVVGDYGQVNNPGAMVSAAEPVSHQLQMPVNLAASSLSPPDLQHYASQGETNTSEAEDNDDDDKDKEED